VSGSEIASKLAPTAKRSPASRILHIRSVAERGDEFGGAGGHGDARGVAQVAAGGVEGEPVVFGEFGGDEAGHGRLALEREDAPGGFADGADGGGGAEGNMAGDGRFAEGGEELVDPFPEDDGFAVGDEIGAAGGTGMSGINRQIILG
jgi:hypothetical protein